MRIMKISLIVTFTLMIVLYSTAISEESYKEYYEELAIHFQVDSVIINGLRELNIADEEIPVALLIGKKTGKAPQEIANMKLAGKSWMETVNELSLQSEIFYFLLVGEVKSKTYAPIFEKYKSTPEKKWDQLELTDGEIINMVNLRFIYTYHDYSVFEVMAMRDLGESFLQINYQVGKIKAEMIKKEELMRKQKAKNEENK